MQCSLKHFLDGLDENIMFRFLSGKSQTESPNTFVPLEQCGIAAKGNPQ